MSLITIDPERLFTTADFARITDVQPQSARAWVRRHWNELPPPVFTLALGGGKFVYVWTEEDGKAVINAYRTAKEQWPVAKWTANNHGGNLNPRTGAST